MILDTYTSATLDIRSARGSVRDASRIKYTKGDYGVGDCNILLAFLKELDVLVTTSHILAEVSNSIVGELTDLARNLYLGLVQETIPTFQEHHVPAKDQLAEEQFRTCGVANIGVLRTAAGRHLVLTGDYSLSSYVNKIGVDTPIALCAAVDPPADRPGAR